MSVIAFIPARGGSKSIPEKNNDEIITAAKTIPRISTVLTKLTEYYSDTTYIVPKDINPIG